MNFLSAQKKGQLLIVNKFEHEHDRHYTNETEKNRRQKW